MPKQENECIIPGCSGKPRIRGLCNTCYSTASLRVRSGLSTWEDLEKAGLALPSKAADRSTFTAALKKQLVVEEADRVLSAAYAANVTHEPERQDDQSPTTEDIRQLAQKVTQNPSAENLHLLAELAAGHRLPQPQTLPASLDPTSEPYNSSEYEAAGYTPPQSAPPGTRASMPELADESLFEDTPMPPGYVPDAVGIVQPRVVDAKTQQELMIAKRQAAMQKRRDLRSRSLADARALAAGKVVEDEVYEDDDMSDEEFLRVQRASELRQREDMAESAASPPLPTPVGSVPAPEGPTPAFSEPELPTDVVYDPALDGSAEGVSQQEIEDAAAPQQFAPVNPISTEG